MSGDPQQNVNEKALKDIPPVPIKTYQWEEVRRSKVKGDYPWTHLSKDPFDPERMEIQTIAVGTLGEAVKDDKIELEGRSAGPEDARDVQEEEAVTASNGGAAEEPKPELRSALKSSFRETEVALKGEPGPSSDRLKRAKSEEGGKRKRKLSIDSSYSRVSKYSLSKLGAVKKKVKEATDLTRSLIKLPRNPFTKSRSKLNKTAKSREELASGSKSADAEKKAEPVLMRAAKPPPPDGQPVYIHIPLKPPAGETDEFSHMEFEGKPEEQRKKEPSPIKEEEPESPVDAPKSVQLIILTAPSDDEILDDVTIPETPSDGDNFFDNRKLEELKTFAKNVADRISPETKRRNIPIEEVDEAKEDGVVAQVEAPKAVAESDPVVVPVEELPEAKPKKARKGTKAKKEKKAKVDPKIEDEEDGLKTAETIATEIIEAEIKEEAATEEVDEAAPTCKLKKTVSFKQRRAGETENDYEEIASPDDKSKVAAEDVEPIKEDVALDSRQKGKLEAAQSQSMTADEERTYLDSKIMTDASLDEDCNKWSKEIDHEYEPVNPPPDTPAPTVNSKPTEQPKSPPTTPSTPTSSNYNDFNHSPPPETGLSKTPVHISTSSLERLASKLAEMDLARTGIQSGRQSRTGSPNGAEKQESHAAKLQEALKTQAEKMMTRVKSMKRPKMLRAPKKPSITLPKRPHIHMPKINTPKMPDRLKNINLSSLSLPKRKAGTSSQRAPSTTDGSTAAGPAKRLFDFSTYPRLFRRKPKQDADESLATATTKSDFDSGKTTSKSDYDSRKSKESEPSSIRIPLHSTDSLEKEGYEREDSVERRMRSSHMQYEDDIDIEDAYMRENQEIHTTAEQHNRWTRGSFHQQPNEYYNENNNEEFTNNDIDKSDSAAADSVAPARGVLEEINQDEFFLRQKGISQDNIEVGAYLSSEIREAFKKPTGTTLDQINTEAYFDQNFDRTSNKSLPETPKRRGVKKPSRRKKTPHVSAEAIQQPYDQQELEQRQRPERPSRKQKMQKQYDSYEMELSDNTDNIDINILGMDEYQFTDKQFSDMYENEIMAGIEQPNITVSDPCDKPTTAPRKRNKSQRSQESEQDSSMMIDGLASGGYESILQRDEVSSDKENSTAASAAVPPIRPIRTRSRTRSRSRPGEETAAKAESAVSLANSAAEAACVEEPCVRNICDNMGYSVITKHRSRATDKSDLPPPAPRRQQKKDKFSTVPRKLGPDESPSRPDRNYSTLIPNRPPRRTSQPNLTDEEKEVDISQYIEIESEDHNRALHSGKVIQKMKGRPLPAPPRPPRQTLRKSQTPKPEDEPEVLETDVSVQTEPLPDNYVMEERVGSPVEDGHADDNVIRAKKAAPKPMYHHDFDHEETVTHGTLLVQPFTSEIGTEPQEFFSRSMEKIITVRKDYVDDLDSEIPEEFMHFRSSGDEHIVTIPQVIERIIERPMFMPQTDFSAEIEILKAQKLQVGDLDVDNLRVNELQASRITVTDIDSSSIQTQEISSRGGNLVVGGIELPASFLQQLLDTIKSANERQEQVREAARQATAKDAGPEEADSGQKKNFD